jgi:hypothetical protein
VRPLFPSLFLPRALFYCCSSCVMCALVGQISPPESLRWASQPLGRKVCIGTKWKKFRGSSKRIMIDTIEYITSVKRGSTLQRSLNTMVLHPITYTICHVYHVVDSDPKSVWTCGCVDVWMCGCVDVWMAQYTASHFRITIHRLSECSSLSVRTLKDG